jgi:hypothetical protein
MRHVIIPVVEPEVIMPSGALVQFVDEPATSRMLHWNRMWVDCALVDCDYCLRGKRATPRFSWTVKADGETKILAVPFLAHLEILEHKRRLRRSRFFETIFEVRRVGYDKGSIDIRQAS